MSFSRRLLSLCLLLLVMHTAVAQHRSDRLDDVLQHVPMASVAVLKLCGADARSPWGTLALTAVADYALAAGTTYSLKHIVAERRPDGSDRRSFPSGHATFAFAGATMLHHEYRQSAPWVSVAGFTLAALVAADRVRLDRHYFHDVLGGAAVGVLSTELTYWLRGKLSRKHNVDVAFTGTSLHLQIAIP